MKYYLETAEAVFEEVKSSEQGLTSEEVEQPEEESHLDDTISSLFAREEKTNVNFKALNESIDKENVWTKVQND